MRAYGQRRQRRHPAGSRSQLRTQRGTSDNHLRKNAASIRHVEDANGKVQLHRKTWSEMQKFRKLDRYVRGATLDCRGT